MKITNINIEERIVILSFKNKDVKVLFSKDEELDFEGIEDLSEEEFNEVSNFVMFNEELISNFCNEEE
jgi:hypothetical protein